MTLLRRLLWPLVLGLLLLAGWRLSLPGPLDVALAEVARGTIRSSVEEEGTTRVVDRYVVAAPVEGTLSRIRLREGDAVRKGDLLAEIDPLPFASRIGEEQARTRSLRARIEGSERKRPKPEEIERAGVRHAAARQALAVATQEKREADAAREMTRTDAERVRGLVASATGTREELDRVEAQLTQAAARAEAAALRVGMAELAVETARLDLAILEAERGDFDWEKADTRAQIDAVEASLALLRDRLARTGVTAPADGTVLRLFEESERPVAAGAPLLELGDLARAEVEADFLSEDAARMRVGMAAEVFGRALGEEAVAGEVVRIYPSAFRKISALGVEQQRVYIVVGVRVPLGDRYRVEVRVLLDKRDDCLLVPEGALFRHNGDWGVFREESGVARLVAVRTGLRDGRMREVLSGLDAGDRVLLHPDGAVTDGRRVRPLP